MHSLVPQLYQKSGKAQLRGNSLHRELSPLFALFVLCGFGTELYDLDEAKVKGKLYVVSQNGIGIIFL